MGDVITSKYAHLSEGISNASMSLCRGGKCSDLHMQVLGQVLQIRRLYFSSLPPGFCINSLNVKVPDTLGQQMSATPPPDEARHSKRVNNNTIAHLTRYCYCSHWLQASSYVTSSIKIRFHIENQVGGSYSLISGS